MPEGDFHTEHRVSGPPATEESAAIAEMVGALSNPSRVALLYALQHEGRMPVARLAEEAGITPSAASQQLRVLRHLRLVVTRREGRTVLYELHDDHVGVMLDAIRDHAEHARLGWSSPPRQHRTEDTARDSDSR